MVHRDAYVCDVVVVPTDAAGDDLPGFSEMLQTHGVVVNDLRTEQGIVEGTVDAGRLKEIDDLPEVEYVRCVYSYIADYPAGDPRDRDG